MKIIIISNPSDTENEPEIITQLFEAGLKTFHLRKNSMSTNEMIAYLEQIPAHFHNRIFIHSHHNLALSFSIKGIHLTENDKVKRWTTFFLIRFIKIKKPGIKITTSFTTLGELYELENKYKYYYAFLNPVFDSSTSKFQGGFSDYSLKAALNKSKRHIIARGGVGINVIEKAHNIGFKGIAFQSFIWDSKDPVSELLKIKDKFLELGIPIE